MGEGGKYEEGWGTIKRKKKGLTIVRALVIISVIVTSKVTALAMVKSKVATSAT